MPVNGAVTVQIPINKGMALGAQTNVKRVCMLKVCNQSHRKIVLDNTDRHNHHNYQILFKSKMVPSQIMDTKVSV
jgi:hypothetical protein